MEDNASRPRPGPTHPTHPTRVAFLLMAGLLLVVIGLAFASASS